VTAHRKFATISFPTHIANSSEELEAIGKRSDSLIRVALSWPRFLHSTVAALPAYFSTKTETAQNPFEVLTRLTPCHSLGARSHVVEPD
jgi:hypothetical protein